MYQARNKPTVSPRSLLPEFRRVVRSQKYAPACAAIYRLAVKLLARGQSFETIASDLAALNRAGIPLLIVAEVVGAARARALVRRLAGGAA